MEESGVTAIRRRLARNDAEKALERTPQRDALFETTSHLPRPGRLHRRRPVARLERTRTARLSRRIPVYPRRAADMYRGRFWTMRQYAGYASAADRTRAIATCSSAARPGCRSHSTAHADGLRRRSSDCRGRGRQSRGVDLVARGHGAAARRHSARQVTTSMTINATAPILLALYVAVAEKARRGPREPNGTVQNDILKEYIARGTYIYPPRPSLRLITDLFAYCADEVPQWNTDSSAATTCAKPARRPCRSCVHARRWHRVRQRRAPSWAGSRPLRATAGVLLDSHNDLLEEVAKFRAARRMWARSCASGSARTIHDRGCCVFIPRRPASRCRPSRSTTMWFV